MFWNKNIQKVNDFLIFHVFDNKMEPPGVNKPSTNGFINAGNGYFEYKVNKGMAP